MAQAKSSEFSLGGSHLDKDEQNKGLSPNLHALLVTAGPWTPSPPLAHPYASSSCPSGGKAPSFRSGLNSSRLGLALKGWVTHSLGLP